MFQIVPNFAGSLRNQRPVSRGEQRNLQLPVLEIPPTDHGSVHKNGRTDDSGKVENVAHMFFREEQTFCFLIAQHELVKASKEHAGGQFVVGQAVIDVEIGLAVQ